MPYRLLNRNFILWISGTLAFLSGCARLQLKLNNASVQKPSNLALYFSVEDRHGEPVGGLAVDSFKIYEDDQLISPFESKQTILNPEESVVHYTLLLLDLSGSITESGSVPILTTAAGSFAERVTKYHQIGVYGFDGGEALMPLVGWTTQGESVTRGLSRLEGRKTKDPSTNLNGAVIGALQVLQHQMERSKQSLRFGTIVIFTDGTDRAHRITNQAVNEALANAPDLNVFVIGLGGEINESQLSQLGRSGFVKATDQANIEKAFNDVADRIENSARKYYLLSYCSPSRAGKHSLKVEVNHAGQSGSLIHEFDAAGFGPECDPNKKPNFPIGRIQKGE